MLVFPTWNTYLPLISQPLIAHAKTGSRVDFILLLEGNLNKKQQFGRTYELKSPLKIDTVTPFIWYINLLRLATWRTGRMNRFIISSFMLFLRAVKPLHSTFPPRTHSKKVFPLSGSYSTYTHPALCWSYLHCALSPPKGRDWLWHYLEASDTG